MHAIKSKTTESKDASGKNADGNHPFFQAKLTVNQSNDVYEREADVMANKVMRMVDPSSSENAFFKPAINHIQRKCQHCEEEEKLHRKENSAAEVQGGDHLDSYVSTLGSSGHSLSESSRSFFEPRFGYDFSNVRVHNDSVAAKSAQSINALAYTTGNNIVFNQGQYSPDSESGKKLMAHELTHVLQQGNDTANRSISNIQRSCGKKLTLNSDCSDALGDITDFAIDSNHHYLFKQNCNDFIPAELERFKSMVPKLSLTAGQTINIHGFASEEGDFSFNEILSCSRAEVAANLLKQLHPLGSSLRINLYSHGATKGDKVLHRAIVIEEFNTPPTKPGPIAESNCGSLSVWMNVFIPKNVPGYTYTIAKGSLAGRTAIPCPIAGAILNPQCPYVGYLTDQRDMDDTLPKNSHTPSVRMRSRAYVSLSPLSLTDIEQTSGTKEIVRIPFDDNIYNRDPDGFPSGPPTTINAEGDVTCSKDADLSSCYFKVEVDNSKDLTTATSDGFELGVLSMYGAASDPCIFGAANIDYNGKVKIIVNVVKGTLEVKFNGAIDDFPAYEMYAEMNGVTKELFESPPPPGNTVTDLLGGASRNVSGNAEFVCKVK